MKLVLGKRSQRRAFAWLQCLVCVVLNGHTFTLGSPLFVLIINNRFILAEEAMLEEAFGEAYREYKARVRRWL